MIKTGFKMSVIIGFVLTNPLFSHQQPYTPTESELRKEVEARILKVSEFKYLFDEAKTQNCQAGIGGSVMPTFISYVYWDLIRSNGGNHYHKGFIYDYTLDDILWPMQDIEVVVKCEEYATFVILQNRVNEKFPLKYDGTQVHGRSRWEFLNSIKYEHSHDFQRQNRDDLTTSWMGFDGSGRFFSKNLVQGEAEEVFKAVINREVKLFVSSSHPRQVHIGDRAISNPEIFSVLRYLKIASQLNLSMDAESIKSAKAIVKNFDGSALTGTDQYALRWFIYKGIQIYRTTSDLARTQKIIKDIGLKKLFIKYGSEKLKWYANRIALESLEYAEPPSPKNRVKFKGEKIILKHRLHQEDATNLDLLYAIFKSYDGKGNLFISRKNNQHETAAHGDGLYASKEGSGSTQAFIEIELDSDNAVFSTAEDEADAHITSQNWESSIFVLRNRAIFKSVNFGSLMSMAEAFSDQNIMHVRWLYRKNPAQFKKDLMEFLKKQGNNGTISTEKLKFIITNQPDILAQFNLAELREIIKINFNLGMNFSLAYLSSRIDSNDKDYWSDPELLKILTELLTRAEIIKFPVEDLIKIFSKLFSSQGESLLNMGLGSFLNIFLNSQAKSGQVESKQEQVKMAISIYKKFYEEKFFMPIPKNDEVLKNETFEFNELLFMGDNSRDDFRTSKNISTSKDYENLILARKNSEKIRVEKIGEFTSWIGKSLLPIYLIDQYLVTADLNDNSVILADFIELLFELKVPIYAQCFQNTALLQQQSYLLDKLMRYRWLFKSDTDKSSLLNFDRMVFQKIIPKILENKYLPSGDRFKWSSLAIEIAMDGLIGLNEIKTASPEIYASIDFKTKIVIALKGRKTDELLHLWNEDPLATIKELIEKIPYPESNGLLDKVVSNSYFSKSSQSYKNPEHDFIVDSISKIYNLEPKKFFQSIQFLDHTHSAYFKLVYIFVKKTKKFKVDFFRFLIHGDSVVMPQMCKDLFRQYIVQYKPSSEELFKYFVDLEAIGLDVVLWLITINEIDLVEMITSSAFEASSKINDDHDRALFIQHLMPKLANYSESKLWSNLKSTLIKFDLLNYYGQFKSDSYNIKKQLELSKAVISGMFSSSRIFEDKKNIFIVNPLIHDMIDLFSSSISFQLAEFLEAQAIEFYKSNPVMFLKIFKALISVNDVKTHVKLFGVFSLLTSVSINPKDLLLSPQHKQQIAEALTETGSFSRDEIINYFGVEYIKYSPFGSVLWYRSKKLINTCVRWLLPKPSSGRLRKSIWQN